VVAWTCISGVSGSGARRQGGRDSFSSNRRPLRPGLHSTSAPKHASCQVPPLHCHATRSRLTDILPPLSHESRQGTVPLPNTPAVIALAVHASGITSGICYSWVQLPITSITMVSQTPNSSVPTPVSFPQPEDLSNDASSPAPAAPQRTSTNASNTAGKIRAASLKLMEASPPPGMWAATGATVAKAPSMVDIRQGSYSDQGWHEGAQRKRASSQSQDGNTNPPRVNEPFPALAEEDPKEAASYSRQGKSFGAAVELRQSTSHTDGSNRCATPPMSSSGQVRHLGRRTTKPAADTVHSMRMDMCRLRSCPGRDLL
jgi:hypothetical protein